MGVPSNLLDQANKLNDHDRALLVAFLKGEAPGQLPSHGIRQILLNEVSPSCQPCTFPSSNVTFGRQEEKAGEGGMRYLEQIIFEINYQNGYAPSPILPQEVPPRLIHVRTGRGAS